MRKLLLPALVLALACESTEPVFNLSGKYEGMLTGTGSHGREAGGTVTVTFDQHREDFDGFAQISGWVSLAPFSNLPWEVDLGLYGTIRQGDEESEITVDAVDACTVNRLSGKRAGLAIVLFGEFLPADESCVALVDPMHVLVRLEPVG